MGTTILRQTKQLVTTALHTIKTSRLSYKYPFGIPIVERGSSLVSAGSFCRPFAVFFSRLTATVLLLVTIGIGQAWGADVTITKTMNEIVSANSYTVSSGNNATCYTSFSLDASITISTSGSANCGSFWGTTTNDWRLYQAQSGDVTITAATGCTLKSVTFTYTVSNTGTLKDGNTTVSSGTAKTISGTSRTYTVGNTGNNTNGQVRITQISVTYTPAAPAYTITASSNNNSWGTVSVSGTTITATPADCYQVKSGTAGYTVNIGTATVAHTGTSNTLTVTPSSDCTIQVNFEKKTVNTYIDEIQDNGELEDCSTETPSLSDKAAATSGTCAQQHYHFVGWVTAANKANPTDDNIIEAGETVSVNGTTYYAVWAKGTSGTSATATFNTANSDGTSTVTVSNQVSSSSGVSSYSGERVYAGTYGVKLGTGSYTGSVGYTLTSAVTTKTITIDAKKYGSDTGTLSVTVNGSTTFGNAQSPTASGSVLTFTNASAVSVSSVSVSTSSKRAYIKTITVGEATTYSDYITTCCQNLGAINGSVK